MSDWSHIEGTSVYTAPGMGVVRFDALLDESGVKVEFANQLSAQVAALQAQLDSIRADMQRQIDEIRSGATPQAAAAPGRLQPQRPQPGVQRR
jgi:outer membrane murein-binding lipoprotein Lpp